LYFKIGQTYFSPLENPSKNFKEIPPGKRSNFN